MNKLSYYVSLLSISTLLFSCDTSNSTTTEQMVKVEFLNPTADTITAKIFSHDGWIVKENVPPYSAVLVDIESGNYSISAENKAGDFDYLPKEDVNDQLDTTVYAITTDEANEKSVRYRFNYRLSDKNFIARYAFDLSFNKENLYATADIRWLYGNEEEKDVAADFIKSTQNGKNFVSSVQTGEKMMLFPERAAGAFDKIPDEMTVYYNTKHIFPKVFSLPDTVTREQSANYLAKTLMGL